MAAENNKTFDIVIVGGGTAGLVLASRLAADPALQVLVLEAGLDLPQLPDQLAQTIMTPAAHTQTYKEPVSWFLRTAPQVRSSLISSHQWLLTITDESNRRTWEVVHWESCRARCWAGRVVSMGCPSPQVPKRWWMDGQTWAIRAGNGLLLRSPSPKHTRPHQPSRARLKVPSK